MKPFSCTFPRTVRFGEGALDTVGTLAHDFGARAALVTGGRSLERNGTLDRIAALLRSAGVAFERVSVKGEPSPATVDSAVETLRSRTPLCVIAVGGGSVIDAGKAIAAMLTVEDGVSDYLEKVGTRTHPGTTLPLIAVPTTAGTGSEATRNAVLSSVGPSGFKASLRHENFVPACALVDPRLHVSVPPDVSAACGMDALTQLIEAFVSTAATPLTDALAWSGLEHLAPSLLAAATSEGGSVALRARMAYAAHMSGIALAHAGLGVVHGIAGAVGALVPIPHGVACGTLLAPATEVTIGRLAAAPGDTRWALEKYARIGRLLADRQETDTIRACRLLVDALRRWADALHMPTLGEYGLEPADAPRVALQSGSKNNPVALSVEDIAGVLNCRMR